MTQPSETRLGLFERAFVPRYVHVESHGGVETRVRFEVHQSATRLKPRGGQLELGGCLFPQDRSLPQGEFAVEIARGSREHGREGPRNDLVRLVLVKALPERWERLTGLTRASSQALDPTARTEQWVATEHLALDAGSMAIAEPGFGERLEQLAHEHRTDFDGVRLMGERGEVDLTTLESTEVLQATRLEGRHSVAFETGKPRGEFFVWGGYTAKGALCRLLIDFEVFA